MRLKNRHLIVEVIFEQDLSRSRRPAERAVSATDIYQSLLASVSVHFGDHGVGACQAAMIGALLFFFAQRSFFASMISAGVSGGAVRCFSPESGIAVVRAPRDHLRMVWSSLTFVTKVKNLRALATVRGNAGSERTMLKKLEKFDPKLAQKLRLEAA